MKLKLLERETFNYQASENFVTLARLFEMVILIYSNPISLHKSIREVPSITFVIVKAALYWHDQIFWLDISDFFGWWKIENWDLTVESLSSKNKCFFEKEYSEFVFC